MKNRIGETYYNKKNEKYSVISQESSMIVTIKFDDGSILENVFYNNVKKGEIKNPYFKTVYGVGFIGVGRHLSSEKGTTTKVYTTWVNMLRRCYYEKTQNIFPTYKDVITCEEWHNFQNFAEWYEKRYTKGFFIDKDIICKDCKIYSPETCCFVPNEINMLFVKSNNSRGKYLIGVHKIKNRYISQLNKNGEVIFLGSFKTELEAFQAYKTAKEKHIKEVVDKWKDQITEPCYEALINYKVKITD